MMALETHAFFPDKPCNNEYPIESPHAKAAEQLRRDAILLESRMYSILRARAFSQPLAEEDTALLDRCRLSPAQINSTTVGDYVFAAMELPIAEGLRQDSIEVRSLRRKIQQQLTNTQDTGIGMYAAIHSAQQRYQQLTASSR